jgi:hypothetical protein
VVPIELVVAATTVAEEVCAVEKTEVERAKVDAVAERRTWGASVAAVADEIVAEEIVALPTVAAALGATMLLRTGIRPPDDTKMLLIAIETPRIPIWPVLILLVVIVAVESPSARRIATPIGPVTQEYSIVRVDAVTGPVPRILRRPPGAIRVPTVALPVAIEGIVADPAVIAADPKLAWASRGELIAVEIVSEEAMKVDAAREDARTRVAAIGAVVNTAGVVGPM